MKTVLVLMAGAVILAAGNGPGMEERARVKYGRTAGAVEAAPSGTEALPGMEQWNRAKFGRVGGTVQRDACAGLGRCAVGAAPSAAAAYVHACCAQSE